MDISVFFLMHFGTVMVLVSLAGSNLLWVFFILLVWACLFCRIVKPRGQRVLVRTWGTDSFQLRDTEWFCTIWPEFVERDVAFFGPWRGIAKLPLVGQFLRLPLPPFTIKLDQGNYVLCLKLVVKGVVEDYSEVDLKGAPLEEFFEEVIVRSVRRAIRRKSFADAIQTISDLLEGDKMPAILRLPFFKLMQVCMDEGSLTPGDEPTRLAFDALTSSKRKQALATEEMLRKQQAYVGAPLPENEERRLARLRECAIMNTDPEYRYDCITSIVAKILNVPICLISLVAEDHQWFKSKCGLTASSTPRKTSFCAFTFLPEDVNHAGMFLVKNAMEDDRFKENPLVLGEPHIRFYGGCPLVGAEGLRHGALCAIDRVQKDLTPVEAQILVNFGQLTVNEIERQLLLRETSERMPVAELGPNKGRLNLMFAAGPLRAWRMRKALAEAVILVWAPEDSLDWTILYGNEAWRNITGYGVDASLFPKSKITVDGTEFSTSLRDLMDFDDGFATVYATSRIDVLKPFSCWASMDIYPRSERKTLRVSCRFNPAAIPLDATAAAIQPYPIGDDEDLMVPYKLGEYGEPGFFYFVTVMEDTFHAETSEIRQVESRTNGTDKDTLTCPFHDVDIIRITGNGSFGKRGDGLWNGSRVMIKHANHSEGGLRNTDLVHPNLVSLLRHVTTKPMSMCESWIVQEWCDGGSLTDYCCIPRHSSEAEIVEVFDMMGDTSRAASYLHGRGIFHDNLSGSNVLRKLRHSRKGYVMKISCDFGVLLPRSGTPAFTRTAMYYMPPERYADGKNHLTAKTDVWSVGVLLWQSLTGDLPFKELTPEEAARQVAQGRRLVLPSGVDSICKYIFEQCTTTSPEDRPVMSRITPVFAGLTPGMIDTSRRTPQGL